MNVNQVIKHSLGRRLPPPHVRRHIRMTAGITQAELGDALGVSRTAVARWESGSRHPSRRLAAKYADALRRIESETES